MSKLIHAHLLEIFLSLREIILSSEPEPLFPNLILEDKA